MIPSFVSLVTPITGQEKPIIIKQLSADLSRESHDLNSNTNTHQLPIGNQ